ncbi:MAG TPA: hypothetical protein VLJ68_07910 [Chitinophagaceae bacterium]|nr:hypothetical protein [Chitinophagaceae bacterium]
MKKIFLPLTCMVIFSLFACNNGGKKAGSTGKTDTITSKMDSLENDVNEGHIGGMQKLGKLQAMQTELERIVDSIEKLPAKARNAMAPFREKVNKVIDELKSARQGMDKWMDEYNMDSALTNANERMKYLAEEKLKVANIQESIVGGIQKADSLIRSKF